MKRAVALLTVALVLGFLVWGCASATDQPVDSSAVSEPEFAQPPILDEFDTWPYIEAPEDLARVSELRDGWISAFPEGNAEALDFVFARDEVMTDLSSLVGEESATADQCFERHTAELRLENERPIEYGN